MRKNLMLVVLCAGLLGACGKKEAVVPSPKLEAPKSAPTMEKCTQKARESDEVKQCRAVKGDFAEACFKLINEYQSLCMSGLR